jgi:hypothetical protein
MALFTPETFVVVPSSLMPLAGVNHRDAALQRPLVSFPPKVPTRGGLLTEVRHRIGSGIILSHLSSLLVLQLFLGKAQLVPSDCGATVGIEGLFAKPASDAELGLFSGIARTDCKWVHGYKERHRHQRRPTNCDESQQLATR